MRLSGPNAIEIVDAIFLSKAASKLHDLKSHSIIYGNIVSNSSDTIIDEVLISVMRAPASYTREDVVEINCHGGALPLKMVLELTLKNGARLAVPGEFTRRAFLNGRIDLVQTEAVLDIIRAKTEAGLIAANTLLKGGLSDRIEKAREILIKLLVNIEAAIDFAEEDIELISIGEAESTVKGVRRDLRKLLDTAHNGKIIRDGITLAITGKPNAGKSSLLNRLLGEEKAIVTSHPGTTRDIISDYFQINGIPVEINDTAGLRETCDPIEVEGVKRAREAAESASLVLFLLDLSKPVSGEDLAICKFLKDKPLILVFNKSDIPPRLSTNEITDLLPDARTCRVSAKTGLGLDELRQVIYEIITDGKHRPPETLLLTNARHEISLKNAVVSLDGVFENEHLPEEILAVHLREALEHLGEIIGITTPEDIINRIFEDFCIGK